MYFDRFDIVSNYAPRECTMGQWLPGFGYYDTSSLYSQLRQQFDYLTADEFDETEFFKYRGVWYSIKEFMLINYDAPFDKNKWNGYASDSYFSGVVIKYCYDGTVIVGTYFS